MISIYLLYPGKLASWRLLTTRLIITSELMLKVISSIHALLIFYQSTELPVNEGHFYRNTSFYCDHNIVLIEDVQWIWFLLLEFRTQHQLFSCLLYSNSDCRMVIFASSGYVVKVTVIDVNLEKCCDYLELYDGNMTDLLVF